MLLSDESVLDVLEQTVATAGVGFAAIVRMFSNNFTPTRQSTPGAFTPADFTGVTTPAAVVTWGTPGFDSNGLPIVLGSAQVQQVGPTPSVGNTIYGWYITSADDSIVLGSEKFPIPKPMMNAGQLIEFVPYLSVQSGTAKPPLP